MNVSDKNPLCGDSTCSLTAYSFDSRSSEAPIKHISIATTTPHPRAKPSHRITMIGSHAISGSKKYLSDDTPLRGIIEFSELSWRLRTVPYPQTRYLLWLIMELIRSSNSVDQ